MDPLDHPNIKLYKKGKKYHFSINKKIDSPPLLTSKAYSSKKSRDNGLWTLIKNLDHLEKEKKDGKFSFTIKAGNNLLLARSSGFSSVEEREEAIDFIKQLFKTEKIKLEGKVKVTSTAKSTTTPSKSADLPPKYSFRLEFYVQDTCGALRGKIEYPFKKEKKAFEGIDISTIESFLRNYLPKEKKGIPPSVKEKEQEEKPVEKAEVPPVEEAVAMTAIEDQKAAEAPKEDTKVLAERPEITAQAAGQPGRKTLKEKPQEVITPASTTIDFDFIDWTTGRRQKLNLNKNNQSGIEVNLKNLEYSSDIYTNMTITVFSTSMKTRNKMTIGQKKVNTSVVNNLVTLPLSLYSLSSLGMQKIEILIKFTDSDTNVAPFFLMGSKMANIYD